MPRGADFTADTGGHELARFARLYEFPDFVKRAELDTVRDVASVPITVFADPVRRQFPCHTKAATWLSALYFLEKKAEFHVSDQTKIQERIDNYVRYWGIKAAWDALAARYAALHKTAESQRPDSEYAYVWTGDDGRKERRMPLTTPMQVKDAADWLATYRDRLPFGDRHAIATKILDKAASLGAALGDRVEFLERQAGLGVCDPAAVARMLDGRALLARDSQHAELLQKLAEAVRQQPRRALQTQDRLLKLAETVDVTDRALGLAGRYTETIPRPEDVIFAATFTKTAADLHAVVATTTGRVYRRADLRKLALDELGDLFGSEFVDRVRTGLELDPEKLAVELSTLPVPDAQVVETLLSDSGVRPILAKAASARLGFSTEDLEALAAHYGD